MQKNVERLGIRLTDSFSLSWLPPEQLSGEYARGLIKMVRQIIISTASCVTLFMDLPKKTVYVC